MPTAATPYVQTKTLLVASATSSYSSLRSISFVSPLTKTLSGSLLTNSLPAFTLSTNTSVLPVSLTFNINSAIVSRRLSSSSRCFNSL